MPAPGENYESRDAVLKTLPLDGQDKRRAALWVCAQAGRGLDVTDPQQLREAAQIAAPLLNMLGLHGDDTWRPSPTAARSQASARFDHGSESGVKAHREAHKPLCRPCRRWVEVKARTRRGGLPFLRPQESLIGLCGTHKRWQGHLADGEQLDPACAMYAQWRMSCMTGQPNGTGPLSRHIFDQPLPVHLDATACMHRLDRAGNGLDEECTGRAGWRQCCSCGWELLVATKLGCTHLQQEHRRQIILRLISEAN